MTLLPLYTQAQFGVPPNWGSGLPNRPVRVTFLSLWPEGGVDVKVQDRPAGPIFAERFGFQVLDWLGLVFPC